MKPTIIDALSDPNLLGAHPALRDLSTWRPWLTFMRAAYGLAPTAGDGELLVKHTGRSVYVPQPGGHAEVVAVVGRQSGKTRIASALVVYEAATHAPVRDGELYAVLVAQDQRSALRTALSYIRSMFEASPLLKRLVVRETTDTLVLENGVRVAAYPCRPASVRGLRACVAVVDELAFFISSEGRPSDLEMLRAIRPALATTGGKLIVLSSPYGQSGALWDLHRKHHGRDDSDTLVWQASAPEMNCTLPSDYLARMAEDDPEAYRSEVLGEFRAGIATLLDPDALDACVARGRLELPPADSVVYSAFVDPSGGSRDAFTCALGHREGGRIVVDCLRGWPSPFNPSGVVAECADLLRRYRVRHVTGDRYAGEWPREAFRAHGADYLVSELDRSRLYLELLAPINAGTVEFPDDPKLLRELRGLERRRGSGGRDRIDHRPGAHDDRANAVAGVAHLLSRREAPVDFTLPSFTAPSYWAGADGRAPWEPWRPPR